MGIIARQSFKAGIVTYLGVAMGVLNNILIYPFMLQVEQYGEIQFVLQTATFFTPLLLLGFGSVLTRYFPNYKTSSDKKQLFYGLIYAAVSINIALFLALFLIFKDSVMEYYIADSGVAHYSVFVLIGVSAILPYINLAKNHSANHGRIAIPSLLSQLLKFFLPLFVVGYYFELYNFEMLIYLLLIYHVALLLVYMLYGNKLDKLRPKISLGELKKDPLIRPLLVFSVFSVLSGVGATMTNQVDILMITSMKGTYANGLYTWSLFIANAIAIPYTLISIVSMPIIAQHWKDDNRTELAKIYKQTSSALLVLSLGIFCAFWLIVDDLFMLMPKGDEFKLAKYVVLMLCLAKIIDMAAGLNSHIISMSKSYKVLLYMLAVAVVVNVGLNFWLIPLYGIEGSAVATIFSVVLFNLLKYNFIRRKYQMQPFSIKSLYALALAAATFGLVYFVPHTDIPLLNMVYISGLAGIIYFLAAYKLQLAPDLNGFVNKQLQKRGLKPFD